MPHTRPRSDTGYFIKVPHSSLEHVDTFTTMNHIQMTTMANYIDWHIFGAMLTDEHIAVIRMSLPDVIVWRIL